MGREAAARVDDRSFDDKVERRTREIAERIFAFLKEEEPSFFAAGGWRKSVIEWSMKDEGFRTQLLRFIDVLPALRSDAVVLRVFAEYLRETGVSSSLLLRSAEVFARNAPAVIAAPLIRSSVRTLAREFIVGADPADARPAIEQLWKEGALVSLDLLGEAVVSEAEAAAYRARYEGLIDFFGRDAAGNQGSLDISLKISSFFSQADPLNFEGTVDRIIQALRPVVEKAAGGNVSLTFDMEQYHYKDIVIGAFKRALAEWGGSVPMTIALQAYLRDTGRDLADLIAWARERQQRPGVRLVKGAYWDYEVVNSRQTGWPVPVFLTKVETDANFEALTEIILENADTVRPAIATHNLRSAAHALALAEHLGLEHGGMEIQSLYGMGGPLRNALRLAGFGSPTRVYCPIGEILPGMAYLVRRVLENTSNESFFRKTFSEGLSPDELAQKPVPKETPPAPARAGEFRNEPLTDFSNAVNRTSVREALARVRGAIGRRYSLLVNGRKITTVHESLSVNPAKPDEVVGRVSRAGTEHADLAVEAARMAFPAWSATAAEQRAELLVGAAAEMRKRRFDLIALEAYEVGKSIAEADGDVAEAIDHLEYNAMRMRELGTPRRLGSYPGEVNEYRYEPRGIAVVIPPWNFPLAIPAGMTSAALVAGNCVILKPSGLSPATAWQLVEVFRAAGIPDGVLQFLPGPGSEIGEHLVSHPGIDLIAFTGSKEVGLRIVERAGRTLPGQRNVKRVVAEMGGKNAVIVDETADLDEAVRGVLESAFGYQGQKCSACSRAIVLNDVFEEFSRRIAEAAKSIEIGPPEEMRTFLGPLIDGKALRKVRRYIDLGGQEGTPVLIRESEQREGFFIGPAIFVTEPDAEVARDEIFGPVLALIRAQDIGEAIVMANGSEYALTGGLYSRSPANIARAKREFLVGNLYINRRITGALVGRQPFGGAAMSGIGSKTGGPDYLLQFMNPRTVSENTMRKGSPPVGDAG
jgi:RHH-type proline utilization regulon transcriptional repressor/proline dehydrogenase/delta 1-pyrroline-5-carboxylate dehydrogenase